MVFVDASARAIGRYLDDQLIARDDRTLEARIVDASEVIQRIGIRAIVAARIRQQQRRGLRHSFEHQHARHDRPVREMPPEEWFVDRDVLQGLEPLVGHFDFKNTVDQQKRIAMRQSLHHLENIHWKRHGFWSPCSCCSRALMRSRSLCNCLTVAAFFSQAALSSMGKKPV